MSTTTLQPPRSCVTCMHHTDGRNEGFSPAAFIADELCLFSSKHDLRTREMVNRLRGADTNVYCTKKSVQCIPVETWVLVETQRLMGELDMQHEVKPYRTFSDMVMLRTQAPCLYYDPDVSAQLRLLSAWSSGALMHSPWPALDSMPSTAEVSAWAPTLVARTAALANGNSAREQEAELRGFNLRMRRYEATVYVLNAFQVVAISFASMMAAAVVCEVLFRVVPVIPLFEPASGVLP